MKRNPIYPLIFLCFLVLLANSFFGPQVKYPEGRDTVQSFGDGSFQIGRISSERKILHSEKYNSSIIENVEFVHERRGKAYIAGDTAGAESAEYRLYALINTSENTMQLCIIPPDSAAPDLYISHLDEMVTNGDAVVYTSLEDFSEEERLVFQKNQAEEIIREGQIIEETDYYRIMESNFLYCCVFFNQQHVVTKTEGPLAKKPAVVMVDENFVRFTVQVGTGIGTQWGYYYDPGTDVFSDVFESIRDESDGKVVYTRQNAVVIRDIFDESKYIKEITEFENTLSPTVEPFVEVQFSGDGKYIAVTYLTGEDYKEITERFAL